MQSVEQQLQKCGKDIDRVEAEIQAASDRLDRAETERDKERWWEKEKLLREKEKQLREKEKQLRDEKKLLLEKEASREKALGSFVYKSILRTKEATRGSWHAIL